jgi:hypothetical protein
MDTAGSIELNGINVISKEEKRGRSRQLFFPWFAGNITVFGISYGAFFLASCARCGRGLSDFLRPLRPYLNSGEARVRANNDS